VDPLWRAATSKRPPGHSATEVHSPLGPRPCGTESGVWRLAMSERPTKEMPAAPRADQPRRVSREARASLGPARERSPSTGRTRARAERGGHAPAAWIDAEAPTVKQLGLPPATVEEHERLITHLSERLGGDADGE
jgi:hypothetical protein